MKKLMLLVLTVVCAFTSVETSFGGTIEDPSGFLSMIDSGKKKSSFSDRFILGDRSLVRIFHRNCTWGCDEWGCGSGCESVMNDFMKELIVANSTEAMATFSDGSQEFFSASELAPYNDSQIRKELSELDVWLGMSGKVVLESLVEIEFLLADGSKIPAFELKGKFETANNYMELHYIIGKETPGMVELLFKSVNSTKIFKVKSVSRL